jgi:hypothetical protein
MVININPNRITTPASRPSKQEDRKQSSNEKPKFITPERVAENYVPEPESLATMIRSAVAAFRQGMAWDRGTILNIVV